MRYTYIGKVKGWGVPWAKEHVQKGDGEDINRIVLVNDVSQA